MRFLSNDSVCPRALLQSLLLPGLLLLGLLAAPTDAQTQLTGRDWCLANGLPDSFRTVFDDGGNKVGFLCAILPSQTDALIADRNPPGAADDEDLDDLVCGYGAHAVGFPGDPDLPTWSDFTGLDEVFLYFVGTYVRPYDSGGWDEQAADPLSAPVATPQDCRRCLAPWGSGGCPVEELNPPDPDPNGPGPAQYESLRILIEGVQAGFLVIQPAQPNYDSNFDFCDDLAKNDDNCAEEVRREALLGAGFAGDSPHIDVDDDNSIRRRVRKLVQYLADSGVTLPPALGLNPWQWWGVADWASMRVGGHSGGSGYAYYLARNLGTLDAQTQSGQTIGHACVLSGPFDTADNICDGPCGPPRIADWYLDNSTDYPVDRLRGVVSEWDRSISSFETTYALLGMLDGVHLARIQSDNYCTGANQGCTPLSDDHLDGHPAIVQEESLAWARTLACYAPRDAAAAYVQAPMLNLDLDDTCALAAPPNRADFLAANPEALDPAAGCSAWGCTQCGYWQANQGNPLQQPRVCLFDNEAYAAANPGLDPADARADYEDQGAAVDFSDYCLPLANTVRRATEF